MNAPIKAAAWDSVTNGPAVQHRWWRPRAVVRIFILMNLDILYRFCCVTTPHLTICTSLHIPHLVLALGRLLLEVMCSVQTKLHLLVSSITIPLGSGLHERMCALHACSIAYNIAAVFVKTPSSTFHHSHNMNYIALNIFDLIQYNLFMWTMKGGCEKFLSGEDGCFKYPKMHHVIYERSL